ncbi:MAG: YjfB family protein [Lachnospiraceae bacterium]|nr:YjfB family protein [Lachnospiraceae bacterium]
MDIPALSMAMSQANVLNQVGTSLLAQQLDVFEDSGDDMVKMMEQSVTPELGGNIDVSV